MTDEQLSLLFSDAENFSDYSEYEDEKQKYKQKIVRNEFLKSGKYGMPFIKKQNINLEKLNLINYVKTKVNDIDNKNKIVHFFTYDWKFQNVYEKPELGFERLDSYYAILTPEFSMYNDMPIARQIDSVFKNRWCGAYWQKLGKLVIPTITWSNKNSFEFCFDGIEKGSIVAVSTYTRENNKNEFMLGYLKMLEKIEPETIICYGDVFPEMKGNIKAIDPYNKNELIKK